jgi:PKD repeat protein
MCIVVGYYPNITFVNTTGESTYRHDIELEPEPTVPEISMDIEPDQNISEYNPMMVDFYVEDFNIFEIVVIIGQVYNETENWLNITATATGVAVYYDPILGWNFGGDLSFDLTYEDDIVEGTTEWCATSSNGGYLVNGTTCEYALGNHIKWIEYPFYAMYGVESYYYNDTITMAPGYAWFDGHTGEYDGFEFADVMGYSSSIPDAPKDDPEGEIAPVDIMIPFSTDPTEVTYESLLGSASYVARDRRSILDLTFVKDEVVPSGDYAVLMFAIDHAYNMNASIARIMVDTERPVADAGEDFTMDLGDEVLLTGGGSDNVGIVNYSWEINDGGSYVRLYGQVISYQFVDYGERTVILTVQDAAGNSDSDEVIVTVEPGDFPVAEAGPGQRTVPEDQPVTFDGTDSYDDDGEVVAYEWIILELDVRSYESEFTHTFDEPGNYTVWLFVEDNLGLTSDPAIVQVTVTDETDPEADAGSDMDVQVGETFTLSGTASDNVGVTEYLWSCDDIEDWSASGAEVEVTLDSEGTYTFTLQALDAAGNIGTDEVTVNVTDPNEPPVANAGQDVEIESGETAYLDASESSDDAEIENYTWTFEYDGQSVVLYGETAEFVFDIAGEYTVNLTVTDDGGKKGYDEVVITVTEGAKARNYAPYAAAVVVIAAAAVVAVLLLRRRKLAGTG